MNSNKTFYSFRRKLLSFICLVFGETAGLVATIVVASFIATAVLGGAWLLGKAFILTTLPQHIPFRDGIAESPFHMGAFIIFVLMLLLSASVAIVMLGKYFKTLWDRA